MNFLVWEWRTLHALIGCSVLGTLQAYPPAPHYTIRGVVKDGLGARVTTDEAEVLLLKGTQVTRRARLKADEVTGDNYSLQIPMEQKISETSYDLNALQQGLSLIHI